MAPDELRDIFAPLIDENARSEEEQAIVKQADALCAYLKCPEELSAGNNEFGLAKTRLEKRWNYVAAGDGLFYGGVRTKFPSLS